MPIYQKDVSQDIILANLKIRNNLNIKVWLIQILEKIDYQNLIVI